ADLIEALAVERAAAFALAKRDRELFAHHDARHPDYEKMLAPDLARCEAADARAAATPLELRDADGYSIPTSDIHIRDTELDFSVLHDRRDDERPSDPELARLWGEHAAMHA